MMSDQFLPLLQLGQTILSFYIYVVIARCLLEMVNASFYHPVSAFVHTITYRLIAVLKMFLPRIGAINLASWGLVYLLSVLDIWLHTLAFPDATPFVTTLYYGLLMMVHRVLQFYIVAIIALAIGSWIMLVTQGFAASFFLMIKQVTDPILLPVRRVLPTLGVFDLSPIAALIALYTIQVLVRSFLWI